MPLPYTINLIPSAILFVDKIKPGRLIENILRLFYPVFAMPSLLKYILWPICIYIAYCGLLFVLQRQIIFPRGMIPAPPSSDQKIPGLEKIFIETESGNVESWLLMPADGSAERPVPVVIFGHGNGEIIDFWPNELKGFNQMGLALLLVEYPGYGRSAGSPSQESITKVYVDAYDALTTRKDIDSSRIVLFGRSLGGGAVCALSLERPSAAMVLMSTFTSARSFAKRYLAPSFLVRDPFDNLAAVKKYEEPLLIMHGRHDTIVPFSHGKALQSASRQAKLIAYNAGHNDCPPDWDAFWKDVEMFLLENEIISPISR
jgi:fermentation-respiration switch protein FrsA (DUF1100 family)